MDTSLITLLANGVSGGIVIVLIILGYLVPKPTHTRVLADSARKDEVIGKLQEALALERQRSNDATQAGAVTNQLIGGLLRLASGHPEEQAPGRKAGDGNPPAGMPALAAGDTGP